MWAWITNLFNNLKRIFKEFIEAAIPAINQVLIAELKDFAVNVVSALDKTDLSDKDKRRKAFDEIKTEAVKSGKDISDSLVNLIIEIALQYIRNKAS